MKFCQGDSVVMVRAFRRKSEDIWSIQCREEDATQMKHTTTNIKLYSPFSHI